MINEQLMLNVKWTYFNKRRFPQQESGKKLYPETNPDTHWNGSDLFPDFKH